LTNTNIKKDIALSASMAGLMLLRATGADLSKFDPGNILLGAVPDHVYDEMQRFVVGWIISNNLDPRDIGKVQIPDDAKDYLPEIANLEHTFYDICKRNGIKVEYYPFVAASAALKLVAAGEKLGLLDAKTGQAIMIYHVLSGSKTVPYLPPS
jgi:hypothetical protein